MAGLLDAQDAALLALGTGLLGGGTFAQALGRGGQGFLSTYAAMQQAAEEKALKERELAMRKQLQDAQIANYLSEAAHRKAQDDALLLQQQRSLDWRNSQPGASMPQVQTALANGAASGSVGPTITNAVSLPQPDNQKFMEWLTKGAMQGEKGINELLSIHKYQNEPQKFEANAMYRNPVTGEISYGPPKLPEGLRMNQAGAVEAAPNAIQAIAQLEAARTESAERAKGKYTFVTRQKPDGTADMFTTTQQADLLNGPPNLTGMQTPGLIGNPADVIEQARKQAKTPEQFNDFLTFYSRQLAGSGGGMSVMSEIEKARQTAGIQTNAATETAGNKAVLDNLQASKTKADAAARNIDTINRLVDALDSNKLMIGPASTFLQYGLQLGNVLGINGKDANERLANTRVAVQGLAQMALDAAPQLAGQGQITEGERALLKRANSGEINELTAPEMKTLLDIFGRAGQLQINSHQKLLENASSIKGLENAIKTMRVDPVTIKRPKRTADEILRQYGG